MNEEKENKKKNGSAKFLDKWDGMKAHKSAKYTAMKTAVDGGLIYGTTQVSGFIGGWALLPGILLLIGGHYFGDRTGVLRVMGATFIGYGVANAELNRAASATPSVEGFSLGALAGTAKKSLVKVNDNWMKALYLDKLFGKKESDLPTGEEAPIGALDLSDLDTFENLTKQSAIKYELQKSGESGDISIEDLEGLNYAIIQEEVDMNTL